jgi:hypothetical protein
MQAGAEGLKRRLIKALKGHGPGLGSAANCYAFTSGRLLGPPVMESGASSPRSQASGGMGRSLAFWLWVRIGQQIKAFDEAIIALISCQERFIQDQRCSCNECICDQDSMAQAILSDQPDSHIGYVFRKSNNCEVDKKTFRVAEFCLVAAANKQFHLRHGTDNQWDVLPCSVQAREGFRHFSCDINQYVSINEHHTTHGFVTTPAHEAGAPRHCCQQGPLDPATYQ